MESSQGHGSQGQWKMSGESFIDSVQHKRHRFTENNQRNDDHFFGGPSSNVNSSTKTSHSGQTSSEPHGPEYIPPSNDSTSPSPAIADDEDPLQKPCEMHSSFTENNQRNDDHFFGGPSSEVNSSTKTSHSGQTSSESRDSDHIPSSDVLDSSSSPIADAEDPLRDPCGMYTRPGWIPRKKRVHGPSHPTTQMFPWQYDNAENSTPPR